MTDNEKKRKLGKKIDKLIMGAIIGGAIGSVLGMTLAPKKGKETREAIKKSPLWKRLFFRKSDRK